MPKCVIFMKRKRKKENLQALEAPLLTPSVQTLTLELCQTVDAIFATLQMLTWSEKFALFCKI